MRILSAILLILVTPTRQDEVSGPPGVRGQAHGYFEFSPQLKTRQCIRTIQLLQSCNIGEVYNRIPKIHPNNTRVKEIDLYFQIIVYKEQSDHPPSKSDLLAFCRRGYCTECLLKGNATCRPPVENKPLEGHGDDYHSCLTMLTNRKIENGDALCLTKSCVGEKMGQCSPDAPSEPSSSNRYSPCTVPSRRGQFCYYVQRSSRTKMLENGKLIDTSSGEKLIRFGFSVILFSTTPLMNYFQ